MHFYLIHLDKDGERLLNIGDRLDRMGEEGGDPRAGSSPVRAGASYRMFLNSAWFINPSLSSSVIANNISISASVADIQNLVSASVTSLRVINPS